MNEEIKDTIRVNRVLGSWDRGLGEKKIEWVDVDIDQCQRTRWKALSTQGRVVLIDLPRYQQIADKDILYEDHERLIVARMKPQNVLVMRPRTVEEMGTLCYYIGNLHQPCWVKETRVFTPNESFLKDLAQSLSIPFSEDECILPQGFATRNRPYVPS